MTVKTFKELLSTLHETDLLCNHGNIKQRKTVAEIRVLLCKLKSSQVLNPPKHGTLAILTTNTFPDTPTYFGYIDFKKEVIERATPCKV